MDLHVHEVPRQGGFGSRWTSEEDEVLIRVWKEWVGPSGQARSGFIAHLRNMFPHRSPAAIRRRKDMLVKSGAVPRQWQRRDYVPLKITENEAAYLAAMLDGEGSLCVGSYIDKRREKHYTFRVPHIVPCYNTDVGIVDYVQRLLPSAKRRTSQGRKKNLYMIEVHGYRDIRDYLTRVLPYLQHTEKRRRAQEILAYVISRIES